MYAINAILALLVAWGYCWLCLYLFNTGNPAMQAAGILALLILAVAVFKAAKE